jgi:hypothetical protein
MMLLVFAKSASELDFIHSQVTANGAILSTLGIEITVQTALLRQDEIMQIARSFQVLEWMQCATLLKVKFPESLSM